MTVFLFHTGSQNLRVILTLLQPQLAPEDDIYIVDTTPHRIGLKLAKLYGTTRSYIFIEVGDYDFETARKFALQSMYENKQDGILTIEENCVISQTFIANLKKAAKTDFGIISPVVIQTPYLAMPSDFKWYNSTEIEEAKAYMEDCFYVKKNGNSKVGLMATETVIKLPSL